MQRSHEAFAPAAPASRPTFVTLVVAAAFFMELFDSTVIVTALPTMARDFNSSVVALSLGITAYMLATTVLLPCSGWLADRYGTRSVFCTATSVFILSSVWCGLSSGVTEFIWARTLQGVGAAMMSPVGRLVVLRATPKEQLVSTMNLMVVPALVGPVVGPPIGGLITTYASWHWCFFINVPIGCTILLLMLKNTRNQRSSERRPFDLTGFALNGIGLSCLIYGANQLSEHWPGNLFTYTLLSTGICVGWLALRHARLATHPLVATQAFSVRTFRVCNLGGGGIFRLSTMAPIFLMPLMFQIGMGMTAFQSGMLLLAHTGGDLLTKIITNRFMNAAGFRRALVGTASCFAACIAVFACFSSNTPYWLIVLVLFIAGVVRSLQMGALNALQFADIAPDHMTHASTLSNMVQQAQRALGVAFAAILLNIATTLQPNAGTGLQQIDFQISFAIMSLIGFAALIWYLRLPKNVGGQLLNAPR